MTQAIHMKLFLYALVLKECSMISIIVHMKLKGKSIIQTRSQTKTNSAVLPKVHGIDKGLDPNFKSETKQ